MYMFRKTIVLCIAILGVSGVNAQQIPSSCFEIESILVDACGNPEGENEMVYFRVGPQDLDVANMNVTWANTFNPWRGICTNATTASKVAQINASITSCGHLVEPVAGILPSGSKVLMITSENYIVGSHSFANLQDTLVVIFQCQGNTNGHFANGNTSPGIRTLTIDFSAPAGCTDQVSYDRTLMVDQTGAIGAADGGRVDFEWNGTATYENDGCTPPLAPVTLDASIIGSSTGCSGDVINLDAAATGEFSNFTWTGGNGAFGNNTDPATTYTIDPADNGTFYLYVTVDDPCNDPVLDSVQISIDAPPSASIVNTGQDTLCPGETTTLFGGGSGSYSWSTGETTPSINIGNTGPITLTVTNGCGTDDATVTLYAGTLPATVIDTGYYFEVCLGDTLDLIASGSESYVWSEGTVGDSLRVNADSTGTIYVYGTAQCGTDTTAVDIVLLNEDECGVPWSIVEFPNVITPNGDGLNDAFRVKWWYNIKELRIWIYNRWGQEVYVGEGFELEWDPIKKPGNQHSDGVYFFVATYLDHNNDERAIKGNVTVLDNN